MRLDVAFAHAADMGLSVEWGPLGRRRGEYHDETRTIVLNERLTRVQAASTLAHELGHAYHRDRATTRVTERRAWEYGAAILISVREFREAERIVGHHPCALALELGVTKQVVEAWCRWYRRTHPAIVSDPEPMLTP